MNNKKWTEWYWARGEQRSRVDRAQEEIRVAAFAYANAPDHLKQEAEDMLYRAARRVFDAQAEFDAWCKANPEPRSECNCG